MAKALNIAPSRLAWALNRAGKPADAVKMPKLNDWLEGKEQPTLAALEEFARKTHTPLGYFFLKNNPEQSWVSAQFRQKEVGQSLSVHLQDTISTLRYRQEWLSTYLQESEVEPLPFVGKFSLDADYKTIAADIQRVIPKQGISNRKSFIEAVAQAGIYVVVAGVVGSNNTRTLYVNECRGFCLIDDYAPFIFINANDAETAQLFTLAHELAHVWLGVNEITATQNFTHFDDQIEKLCNAVAAEYLVPEAELLQYLEPLTINKDNWQTHLKTLHKAFHVSELALVIRLKDIGIISSEDYQQYYKTHVLPQIKKWDEQYEKKSNSSGGDYYLSAPYKVGIGVMPHIRQALQEGKLLHTEAYKVTGVYGKTFDNLLNKVG